MVANFVNGIPHALLQHIFCCSEYWFGVDRGFGPKEKLFTLLLFVNPDLKWCVMRV